MSSALLASLVRFGVQLISLITQSDLNCSAAKWPKIVVYPFAACFKQRFVTVVIFFLSVFETHRRSSEEHNVFIAHSKIPSTH